MAWSKEDMKEYQRKYREQNKEKAQLYKQDWFQRKKAQSWEEKERQIIQKANEKWMNS